jgi:hypothetical protein
MFSHKARGNSETFYETFMGVLKTMYESVRMAGTEAHPTSGFNGGQCPP